MGGIQLSRLPEPFSPREVEILRLIKEGLTNQEIARTLFLSLDTVKWYNQQIFAKLGVNSRTRAIEQARRNGLIDPQAVSPTRETTRRKHNLPAPLSSFIGRRNELVELHGLLLADQIRLVTLTGAGGSGKTRLALQAANEVLDAFPEGVWFVEFAPLSDPALVPQTVITTLGLIDQARRPPLAVLADFLQEKQALLILDNCEHLIQTCAKLAETLLRLCPKLHILATSREGLGVPGEVTFSIPTLTTPDVRSLPPIEALGQYEAVQLFVERAQSALPGFALTSGNAPAVAQVCQQLDGIPLALELAAARVKLLRVEQIASRLDDRFRLLTGGARTELPRHQTLQALIDWSYDLLSGPERLLLQRLSVFAGGWTLEAAESICSGHGLKGTEILDLLTTLVGKSLIIADRNQGQETRFRLLETVRQYAGEKLARDKLSNEEESHWLRTRHRDYYLQLVETAAEKFTSGGRREWTHRLSLEHDNLRLALEWSFHDCVEVEAGLRIAVAFVLFMGIQGYEREGIDWLLVGLERCRSRPISALLRAQALNALGNCLWFMGDFTAARRWLEMSIAACRELGAAAAAELSTSLAALGMSSVYDDPTFARDLLEESVAVARGLDSARGQYLRTALFFKAWISIFSLNERESALQDAQEAYALALQVGVREERAAPLLIMGRVAFERNDFELARRHYEEALAIFEEATDRYGAMEAYLIIGQFYSDQGNYDQSLLHYREFFRIWNFFGSRQPITLSYVALLGSLEVRQFQRSPVERRYVHLQRAAIFFGAVEKLRGELNIFDRTYSLADYTREVETLRSHLEEADLVQAWSAGQAMILEQALAYLLETYG